jgi:hypothetical protein
MKISELHRSKDPLIGSTAGGNGALTNDYDQRHGAVGTGAPIAGAPVGGVPATTGAGYGAQPVSGEQRIVDDTRRL